ncbi:hypothetical protein KY342_00750 [Candidatus Woesearchaeota archaeon]|nr:hypothetical protein [Candidatus Woesearchaeota archaeon]
MKGSKIKFLSVIALLLIGLLAVSGIVKADSVPVEIRQVKVNGDTYDANDLRGDLIRDDEVEVKVKIYALEDDEHIVVKAEIDGLDHDEELAEAETDSFTVKEGRTYYKTLNLKLPERMDAEEYKLRIEVSNRNDDDEVEFNIMLDVSTPRDSMRIKDVIFNPDGVVKAGRALITNVRIKNNGERDQEGVRVRVSVPALGVSDSAWLDEVEEEDSVTSEDLFMRIPQCAEPGDYEVEVSVEYDEGDEEVSTTETITVVENEVCGVPDEDKGQTIITVGSDVQDVVAGESGVVYPISLSNTGSSAITYQVSVEAGDWADVKVSPNVVVLDADETKMVYVYVAAKKDATVGEQAFGVEVKSGDKVLKEFVLKANVAEPAKQGLNLKKGLEVGLVVLVVLLVVVGLVVGFKRLKEDEEEPGQEQTYY